MKNLQPNRFLVIDQIKKSDNLIVTEAPEFICFDHHWKYKGLYKSIMVEFQPLYLSISKCDWPIVQVVLHLNPQVSMELLSLSDTIVK